MAQLMKFEKLHRLTLTTKGKSIAKHPALRSGVVEVVKANAFQESQENESGAEEKDWYAEFDAFVDATGALPQDTECWEEAFALADTEKESAKRKNYPDSKGPFAGPHNSFPINSQAHVYAAAKLIGHAQNPAQVKANIIRIARAKGYSLPKSWQTKKVSSLELTEEQTKVLTNLADLLGSTEVDKARTPAPTTHGHDHSHLSAHGYSYSHNHDHQHTPDHMAAHDTHETAHAHTHLGLVQKASMDEAELKAELDGLHKLVEALTAKHEELATKFTEKESALTDATAKLEEAATKHKELEDKVSSMETAGYRKPLTAAPPTEEKVKITPNMKFDDAFRAIMHGNSGN